MSLDISSNTEARLAAKAREQGLSVEALIEQFLNEAGATSARAASGEPPMPPVRFLGVRGSLHRRDIYHDVC